MQFFILVIINIFIGAVLYLVISLKLERSASEFREKRLRKEMDAIIKEFNSVAEMNISLLENKISVMKRLLENNGDLKSIDLTVGNDRNNLKSLSKENSATPKVVRVRQSSSSKKSLLLYLDKFIITLKRNLKGIFKKKYFHRERSSLLSGDNSFKEIPAASEKNYMSFGNSDYSESSDSGILIEKDLSCINNSVNIKENIPAEDEDSAETDLNDEEIYGMFESSEDKYHLISELHGRGYSAESISGYSGIPVSEIRLVLNLKRA